MGIICCDDFGMCDSVNRGIIDVLKSGKIYHVEIIGNSPYSEEAIKYCLEHPHVRVGCHVTTCDEFNIGFKFTDNPIKDQINYLKNRGLNPWRFTSHMFTLDTPDRKLSNCTWESYYIRPEAKKSYYDFTIKMFPEKEIIIHCADEKMRQYTPWWQSYVEDTKYFKDRK